ncbi:hypothetical protein [Pseudomonas defluvii]|uniref:hypothetical protein n=1 Tax=Pseudomonas defluvii TaxID=1876757 RepID=UPI003905EA61
MSVEGHGATPVLLERLPGEARVERFESAYHDYYERYSDPFDYLSFIGWMIMVVGLLIFMLGPKSLSVSVFGGPTFFEMMLLSPGPIVMLGAILISVTTYINHSANDALHTHEAFFEKHYAVVVDGVVLAATDYVLTYKGEGVFSFQQSAESRSPDQGAA